MNTAIPACEATRLTALYRYHILDTLPEAAFDDLTCLAASICQTPIALISLVDRDRQWFKSKVGLEVSETPRSLAFCAHAILDEQVLIVPDAQADARFANNPLVTHAPNIRFYAGAPLITPGGDRLGTLCVIDAVSRQLTVEQIAALQALSRQVITQLELRLSLREHQQTEQYLRAIINTEPECIKLISADGRLLDMNAAGLAIIEAEGLETVLGQSMEPLITPPYRAAFQSLHQRVCQGEKGKLEFEIVGLRGTHRWLETHAVPLKIGPQQDIVHLAITRDITEQKFIEETLLQQEALLRSTQNQLQHLLASSPAVIYSCRPSGDFRATYVSNNVSLICGYTSEDLTSDAYFWSDHIHPDDLPRIMSALTQLPMLNHLTYEYRFLHKDGTYRWTQDSLKLIRDQTGEPIEIVGCWQDITERKQAELALQASEEHFRLLVEGAKDYAIYLLNPEGYVISWNAGAESLEGYSAAEILGQPVKCFYTEADIQSGKPEENLRTAIAQGWAEDEGWRVRKDGSQFWANVLVSALYDDAGKLRGFSKVVRDITEKQRIEKQFLRAQRLESLGTLAGGIAHDLNNVLAPVLMAAQLLRMQMKDEQCQQWIAILEGSARRGADLVKQVLSFARGMDGERVLLEVQHLLQEIQQIVVETFPKTITFSLKIDPQLWPIYADATQIHQVLMNLSVNARDAMPQGGKLHIQAENLVVDEHYARMQLDLKPGSYIRLTISDTGTGMAPEVIDRIFEPFFTTKDVGKGTGMGLSTTLGIIKGHEGVITVTSKLAKGSEFQVFLPASEVTTNPSEAPAGLPRGQGELILVVDDEAPIREITQSLLEQNGYRVLVANDGLEALVLYVQHQAEVSLAIVDMMMPTMDGSTTIQALHKVNPAVNVIAVSGLMSNHQLNDTVRSAIQAFLPKPFTAQELLMTLDQVLAVTRSPALL